MKTIKWTWKEFNKNYDLCLRTSNYVNNNRLYVGIMYYDTELKGYEIFSDLTINIPSYELKNDYEIVINNDTPIDLIEKLEDLGILLDTYDYAYSGFSQYKVMIFNKELAKEYMLESEED
jgi:hypothetical protein